MNAILVANKQLLSGAVFNVTGPVRKATKAGRKYLVAHMTLIVPGVLEGSLGPIYYPPEENSKDPAIWNSVPLVVYHPLSEDGQPAGARPSDAIGFADNAKADPKAVLQCEGWFDIEATRKADNKFAKEKETYAPIYPRLLSGDKIELSTGLYLDSEKAPDGSVHNGKSYTHVARNYKPDHIAILPDLTGACSINDGCGVNNAVTDVSYGDKADNLRGQLRERFGYEAYMSDMYPSYVVYSKGEKYWSLNYTEADGKCVLSEEKPQQVLRRTIYEPVKNHAVFPTLNILKKLPSGRYRLMSKRGKNLGTFKTRQQAQRHEREVEYFKRRTKKKAKNEGNPDMNRDQMVATLAANCACWKGKEKLLQNKESFSDAELKAMCDDMEHNEQRKKALNKGLTVNGHTIVFNSAKGELELTPTPAPTSGGNTPPAPATIEQWLASTPPQFREQFQEGQTALNAQKLAIINQLTGHIPDAAQKQQVQNFLNVKPLAELRMLANMMPPPVQQMPPTFDPNLIPPALNGVYPQYGNAYGMPGQQSLYIGNAGGPVSYGIPTLGPTTAEEAHLLPSTFDPMAPMVGSGEGK